MVWKLLLDLFNRKNNSSSLKGRPRPPESFREFLHLRFSGRDKLFLIGDKVAVNAILKDFGFLAPELYHIYENIEDINFHGLPTNFVLKPTNLASKRGVYVLSREGDGFRDFMHKRLISGETIREELASLQNERLKKGKKPFKVIAEERVASEDPVFPVPLDYKFYTFNGRIELILQIDRNQAKPQMVFYGKNFFEAMDDDNVIFNTKRVKRGTPVVPECHREMCAMASELSRRLMTPFVSIDMYASVRGPLVGEITKSPGGPYYGFQFRFSDRFDRYLGACWRAAAAEIDHPLQLIDGKKSFSVGRKRLLSHGAVDSDAGSC